MLLVYPIFYFRLGTCYHHQFLTRASNQINWEYNLEFHILFSTEAAKFPINW